MADNNSLGEIISKETADRDFGQASSSKPISSDQLETLAGQTPYLLMFKIISDRLVILGDDRKPLHPEDYAPDPDSEFRVFSKEKVHELIEIGGETSNSVEYRGDIITITNGDYTLEYGALCPPWCSGS